MKTSTHLPSFPQRLCRLSRRRTMKEMSSTKNPRVVKPNTIHVIVAVVRARMYRSLNEYATTKIISWYPLQTRDVHKKRNASPATPAPPRPAPPRPAPLLSGGELLDSPARVRRHRPPPRPCAAPQAGRTDTPPRDDLLDGHERRRRQPLRRLSRLSRRRRRG
jgi:hypothetical protein